jgi:hypothetical protein
LLADSALKYFFIAGPVGLASVGGLSPYRFLSFLLCCCFWLCNLRYGSTRSRVSRSFVLFPLLMKHTSTNVFTKKSLNFTIHACLNIGTEGVEDIYTLISYYFRF